MNPIISAGSALALGGGLCFLGCVLDKPKQNDRSAPEKVAQGTERFAPKQDGAPKVNGERLVSAPQPETVPVTPVPVTLNCYNQPRPLGYVVDSNPPTIVEVVNLNAGGRTVYLRKRNVSFAEFAPRLLNIGDTIDVGGPTPMIYVSSSTGGGPEAEWNTDCNHGQKYNRIFYSIDGKSPTSAGWDSTAAVPPGTVVLRAYRQKSR